MKQFSVFAENRVGRLYDLTTLFAENQVHVIALTVLDTTDSAIVRLIVDDPDRARELMINNDFPYRESDVLAVELMAEGDLRAVLAALLEAEINVHYVYSFMRQPADHTVIALNVEDTDVAAQALSLRGFKVLALTQRAASPRRLRPLPSRGLTVLPTIDLVREGGRQPRGRRRTRCPQPLMSPIFSPSSE